MSAFPVIGGANVKERRRLVLSADCHDGNAVLVDSSRVMGSEEVSVTISTPGTDEGVRRRVALPFVGRRLTKDVE